MGFPAVEPDDPPSMLAVQSVLSGLKYISGSFPSICSKRKLKVQPTIVETMGTEVIGWFIELLIQLYLKSPASIQQLLEITTQQKPTYR